MSFLMQHAEDRAAGKVRPQRGGRRPPLNNPRVLPPGMTVRDLERACTEAQTTKRAYYHRRKVGLTHEQALAIPSQHGVPLSERLPVSLSRSQATVNAALRAWR